MNEGANCIASEIIRAGFSMFSCRIGQGTEKPGEPHQNRCTVFDEGRLPRPTNEWQNSKSQAPNSKQLPNYKSQTASWRSKQDCRPEPL